MTTSGIGVAKAQIPEKRTNVQPGPMAVLSS